jgi:hypothetical protein
VTAPVGVGCVTTVQVPGVTVKLACAYPGLLLAPLYVLHVPPSVYVLAAAPVQPPARSPQMLIVPAHDPPVGLELQVHGPHPRMSVSPP